MNPSRNLFLIGPTGAGKTSIGRWLAAHYRLDFVDLDAAIERAAGVCIGTIFEAEGEAGFRHRESAMLNKLSPRTPQVLSLGAGAVLDESNRCLLRTRGFVLWLQVELDVQWARLRQDSSRPLLTTSNPLAVLREMTANREPLYHACADLAIATGTASVAATARRCQRLLDQHWLRLPVTSSLPLASTP